MRDTEGTYTRQHRDADLGDFVMIGASEISWNIVTRQSPRSDVAEHVQHFNNKTSRACARAWIQDEPVTQTWKTF